MVNLIKTSHLVTDISYLVAAKIFDRLAADNLAAGSQLNSVDGDIRTEPAMLGNGHPAYSYSVRQAAMVAWAGCDPTVI